MIILSEITGKEYDSVSECLYDEQKFKTEQEEAKKAEEAHKKEVDKAYEAAVDACEKYFELIGVDIHKLYEDECKCSCNCDHEDEDEDEGLIRVITFKPEENETIDEMFDRIMELI